MTFRIRRVEYVHVTVKDRVGEAYSLLMRLAEMGVDLLAFTAVPLGGERTQLTVFPADPVKLRSVADRAGIELDGPHAAILAQGDDKLGALVEVHEKLAEAGVDVYASSGVADGRGGYGYIVHVRPEELAKATRALGI
jgi:predicted amino acid-binding ACT domain protein